MRHSICNQVNSEDEDNVEDSASVNEEDDDEVPDDNCGDDDDDEKMETETEVKSKRKEIKLFADEGENDDEDEEEEEEENDEGNLVGDFDSDEDDDEDDGEDADVMIHIQFLQSTANLFNISLFRLVAFTRGKESQEVKEETRREQVRLNVYKSRPPICNYVSNQEAGQGGVEDEHRRLRGNRPPERRGIDRR